MRVSPLVGAGAVGAAGYAGYRLAMEPSNQTFGPVRFSGSGSARQCALTFDDGPNEPFTSELADILASRGVKATFFQVGSAVARTPEVTRRLLADGHVIGNHSLTHTFGRCFRGSDLRVEVGETQAILTDVIGAVPALYRPPWLLRTPALFPVLESHGLTAVTGAFCHPLEVFQPNPEMIAARARTQGARPGSIVIFHDGWDGRGGNRASTVEAAKRTVDTLLEQGVEFVTVDRLLGLEAYRPVA